MTVTPETHRARPQVTAAPGLTDRLAGWAPQLHRHGLALLRVVLGLVYIWFGVLKVIQRSPAAELVTGVIPFHTGNWAVTALGCFEVVLGIWFASGRALGWALPIFCAHLVGTFGVLVMMPHESFQHGNPVLLTMDGEFVVKNLVLLTAGVVVATVPRPGAGPAPTAAPGTADRP
ncbi:hypothetical protein ACIQGZ_26670 [Streptomyces sp. NPDC092296]|uniref:hypothetical protein n=1 Tax=Streptomyces sp. NPDC092296 TaxID=3366012 RepID=UPI0037FB6580